MSVSLLGAGDTKKTRHCCELLLRLLLIFYNQSRSSGSHLYGENFEIHFSISMNSRALPPAVTMCNSTAAAGPVTEDAALLHYLPQPTSFLCGHIFKLHLEQTMTRQESSNFKMHSRTMKPLHYTVVMFLFYFCCLFVFLFPIAVNSLQLFHR